MTRESIDSVLSPGGLQRRDAMRGAMIGAFANLHRARRRRRRASAALALVVLLTGGAWLAAQFTTAAPGTHHVASEGAVAGAAVSLVEIIEGPAGSRAVEFALVAEGASLVTDVAPGASFVEVIDDDRLVETLAEMNRPAGLIAVGGTVRLTRAVTDEPTEQTPPGGGSHLDRPHLPERLAPHSDA